MYCSATSGEHHKSAEANAGKFFLMRWYYEVYPFFGYCCVGQELFYILLFVLKHDPSLNILGLRLEHVCWWVCAPAWAIKQLVNLCQLASSCYSLAEQDAENANRAN